MQQNGDVSNKKKKLDDKNNMANISEKKTNVADNKNKSLKNDKNNKKVNKNTAVVNPKTKDAKLKESKAKDDIKNDTANKVRAKKSISQAQIVVNRQAEKSIITAESSKINVQVKREKQNRIEKKAQNPKVLVNKVKNFQKQLPGNEKRVGKKDASVKKQLYTPTKKVKFELKNNSMQKPVDYYKSVRQSPNIPFDSTKQPSKTNLKPSTPSPINPFFKKKLRMKL